MSNKFSWLTKIGLEILGLGLLAYMASRTLDFVDITMPDDKQYWGYLFLLSTGIGSLIWAGVYLTFANGMKQRGISFAMGIIDLLGELGLVYADTQYVSSQSGKVVMTPAELNNFILLSIGMIGINALAYYFFKLLDPEAESQQNAQDLVDHTTAAALKNLNTPAEKQKMIEKYRPQIENAIMAQVAYQIGAQISKTSGAIDIQSRDMPPQQKALPVSDLVIPQEKAGSWLDVLGEKLGAKKPVMEMAYSGNSTQPPKNIPEIIEHQSDEPTAPTAQPVPTQEPVKREAHMIFSYKKYQRKVGRWTFEPDVKYYVNRDDYSLWCGDTQLGTVNADEFYKLLNGITDEEIPVLHPQPIDPAEQAKIDAWNEKQKAAQPGERMVEDTMRANECSCPTDYLDPTKSPSERTREYIRAKGGAQCFIYGRGQNYLARASETCGNCAFFTGAPKQ